MGSLENKLFEAASKGNIDSLQILLNEDPLILDRVGFNYLSETPLHVAAMLGHVEFVNEIIRMKPDLTSELNSHQSTPLHLASAKGHVDIVRALLSVDPETCMARDRNGLTPLHLAAIKGRLEILNMLLQAKPDAARLVLYTGENILHLCVKYYQPEALKLLVRTIGEPEMINTKDSDGNTVLHLAVADKQVEVIDFLLSLAALEVNGLNLNGMTAVDVLIRSKKDVRDSRIEISLKNSGGNFGNLVTNYIPSITNHDQSMATQDHSSTHMQNNMISWERLPKQQEDNWLDKKRNSLMVVASLIATMAFQIGVNPPSGVWQDDNPGDPQGNPVVHPHTAGFSVMARNFPDPFRRFYIVNTIGFIASLSIILLLMSGLPLRRRFCVWVLMVITWIAIIAVALIYAFAIFAVTPTEQETFIVYVVGFSIFVWAALMGLLLIGHTIRMLVKVIKKVVKALCPRPRRRMVVRAPVLVNNQRV